MDSKHTPGLWDTTPSPHTGEPAIYADSAPGLAIAVFCEVDADGSEAQANAARAVACVNACEGIEDPAAALAEVRDLLAWAHDSLVEERGYNDPSTDRIVALLNQIGRS